MASLPPSLGFHCFVFHNKAQPHRKSLLLGGFQLNTSIFVITSILKESSIFGCSGLFLDSSWKSAIVKALKLL